MSGGARKRARESGARGRTGESGASGERDGARAALRLRAVRAVVCTAFLAGIALSPKLWLSDRSYPLVSVLGAFPPLPSPLDAVFLAGFVAALAVAAFARSVLPAVAALGFALALALQDQSRWQPWAYQYVAMLAAIVALTHEESGSRSGSRSGTAAALDACRAVVAGIYFWSGVQKLNATFFSTGLAALVDEGRVSAGVQSLLVGAGWGVPFVEAAIGVGLLFPRTRRAAATGAIGMHALLLLLLGPLGQDWNSIVWPWNVAMAALVVLLFFDAPAQDVTSARRILAVAPSSHAAHGLVALLFWFAPALSFVGGWDSYLSATLYSRNIAQGAVRLSPAAAARLPPDVRARVDADGWLWAMDWSLDELNAPAVPERRVYAAVARAVCRASGLPEEAEFVFASKPHILTGERDVTTQPCADVGGAAAAAR